MEQRQGPLSWPEQFVVAEAWLTMLCVVALLRTRWRKRLFTVKPSSGESRLSQRQVQRAIWLVNGAANHHIKPMTCLERALTLQFVLARRGCSSSLRFGVEKGEDENFAAHAWLEGVPGLTDPLSSNFIPLKDSSEWQ